PCMRAKLIRMRAKVLWSGEESGWWRRDAVLLAQRAAGRAIAPTGSSSAAASVRFVVVRTAHASRADLALRRSLTGTLRASTHKTTRRRRSAFAITETELKVMAALAMIGLRSSPKIGYSTPAASGTPSAL